MSEGEEPRGSRPDAVSGDTMYLIKNVSRLRLTYQVRLLTYSASQSSGCLVIRGVCPSFGCADRFEPSGRMSSLEQQLELYGGESAEAALATPAVVRALDPVHDREP